jgi:catechol 2,3-dioxygenase-like lactoylglutathione lyase family enzyme
VRDYDEALAFYVGTLGFSLIEDTYMPAQDKRWVTVAPPGSTQGYRMWVNAKIPSSRPTPEGPRGETFYPRLAAYR